MKILGAKTAAEFFYACPAREISERIMVPRCESKTKIQRQVISFTWALAILILLTLHLNQKLSPFASGQSTNGKTSFASTSFNLQASALKGASKTSDSGSSSKFREQIAQLQRKQQQQQQQQVIEQRQQQVIEQQQQVIEQQQLVQVDRQEQTIVEQAPIQQQRQRATSEQSSIDLQQQPIGTSEEQTSSSIYGAIKGTPGVDFPAYKSIPHTKFSCAGAPYEPGMYADETTNCQVYHLCYQGRRESFLCGIGTVFNQAIMTCDHWHSVDCAKSSQYYSLNADFGKSSSEPSQGGGSSKSASSFIQQRVLQRVQLPSPIHQQHVSSFQLEQQTQELSAPPPTKGGTSSGRARVASSSFQVATPRVVQQQLSLTRNSGQFSAPGRQLGQFSAPGRQLGQLKGSDGFSSGFSGVSQLSLAESSPRRSITSSKVGARQHEQVSLSMIVLSNDQADRSEERESAGGTKVKTASKSIERSSQAEKQVLGKTAMLKSAQVVKGRQPSSLLTIKTSNEAASNEIWKPYFKSKTAAKSAVSSSAVTSSGKGLKIGNGGAEDARSSSKWPPLTGAKSTSSKPDTSTSSEPHESGASTVAQADQEPNFGGSTTPPSAASGESSPEETPKVPKSEPPPPPEAENSASLDQTTQSSPAAIESDISQALGSTTPASEIPRGESSAPATEPPPSEATTSTSAPPTTTTSSDSPSEPPLPDSSSADAPATTTTVVTAPVTAREPDATTTTTTSTQSPVTTTTASAGGAPDTTASGSTAPASGDTEGASGGAAESPSEEMKEKRKKKRFVKAAGVEYASSAPNRRPSSKPLARQANKTTSNTTRPSTPSSSVEYAKEHRASR